MSDSNYDYISEESKQRFKNCTGFLDIGFEDSYSKILSMVDDDVHPSADMPVIRVRNDASYSYFVLYDSCLLDDFYEICRLKNEKLMESQFLYGNYDMELYYDMEAYKNRFHDVYEHIYSVTQFYNYDDADIDDSLLKGAKRNKQYKKIINNTSNHCKVIHANEGIGYIITADNSNISRDDFYELIVLIKKINNKISKFIINANKALLIISDYQSNDYNYDINEAFNFLSENGNKIVLMNKKNFADNPVDSDNADMDINEEINKFEKIENKLFGSNSISCLFKKRFALLRNINRITGQSASIEIDNLKRDIKTTESKLEELSENKTEFRNTISNLDSIIKIKKNTDDGLVDIGSHFDSTSL